MKISYTNKLKCKYFIIHHMHKMARYRVSDVYTDRREEHCKGVLIQMPLHTMCL